MDILCYLKENQSEIMEGGRLVKMMRRGTKVVERRVRRKRDRGKCKKEVSSEVENLHCWDLVTLSWQRPAWIWWASSTEAKQQKHGTTMEASAGARTVPLFVERKFADESTEQFGVLAGGELHTPCRFGRGPQTSDNCIIRERDL